MRPCLSCGELAEGSYCEDHAPVVRRRQRPEKKLTKKQRGYDHRWRKLSEKARAWQPFCSDCGGVEDLQADHSPEAWGRYRRGLAIRLRDVDVVCGPCNRARGDARNGGEGRSADLCSTPGAQGTDTITHNYAESRIIMQEGGER